MAYSATAMVEECLEAVGRWNPKVNALLAVLDDSARDAAKAADDAWASGAWLGVLHGIPVSVKDQFAVEGHPTTHGSDFYSDNRPVADAPLVGLLRSAGAVIMGKNNMSELGCGATNHNPSFGDCRNPWNTSLIPGGSSGGSATAVVTGMSNVSFGTDAGGSVRTPASLCGVVGLRPTRGRIPSGYGNGISPEAIPDFTTPGPLARTVADVTRAMSAVDCHVPDDPSSAPGTRDNLLTRLKANDCDGLRVGVPRRYFFDELQPDGVERAVLDALAVFESAGAELVDIELPGADRAQEMQLKIMLPQYAAVTEGRIRERPETFGAEVRGPFERGLHTDVIDHVDAVRWRTRWAHVVARTFREVDIIATPTTPVTAPEVRAEDMLEATLLLGRNTYPWSMADSPSISLPCGHDSRGLPIGLQLTAPAWRDDLLITAGSVFQKMTSWHAGRPPEPATA